MRQTIARLTLAVTSMVALALLIPLAILARQMVSERAIADARAQAGSIIAVLAASDDRQVLAAAIATTSSGAAGRLAVTFPDQGPVGTSRASSDDLNLVRGHRRAMTAPVQYGEVYLQPVALDGSRTAVIEVFIPSGDLTRGVTTTWLSLGGLAVVLILGSILVSDRLAARVVHATRGLARAASRLGAGDLAARVEPAGPPELVGVGTAFNAMADRIGELMEAERELAADLSHRLRTPLTALRLDTERLPNDQVGDRIRGAVLALEDEIEAIITGVRQGTSKRSAEGCDLVEVLADRLAFWAVLAEDHDRPWKLVGAEHPIFLPVPRDDVIGAVDALLGNIFEHTPQSTSFRVTVLDDLFMVEDSGPGIADVAKALRRGVSGSGSTGLGLDIARRVSEVLGGELRISRSDLGGARIAMHFPAQPTRP